MRIILQKAVFLLLLTALSSCESGVEIDSLSRVEVHFQNLDPNLQASIHEAFSNYFRMLNEYDDSAYKEKIYDVEGNTEIPYTYDIKGGMIPGTESFIWNELRYYRKINSTFRIGDPYFIYKSSLYTLIEPEIQIKNIDDIKNCGFYRIALK